MKLKFLAQIYIKNAKSFPVHLERIVHTAEDAPPVHSHDFNELFFVVHGRAAHYFEGKTYPLYTNDVVMIRPGEYHAFYIEPGQQLEIINCLFLPHIFEESWIPLIDRENSISSFLIRPLLNKHEEFHPRLSLGKQQSERVKQVLEQLMTEYEENRAYALSIMQMKLSELLMLIIRFHEEDQIRQQMPAHRPSERMVMLRGIQRYMEENYEQKLNIEMLARSYGFSGRHLKRLFKQETGMTITEMSHHIRVEKAKLLLAQTKEPIVAIAGRVGYEDPSFFSRLFARKVKCSPGKYREQVNKS
ncbi:AraC family transcriptional regulator [Cohnella silvisoli]|uniref:AraC family transcriptional regulator n=1 Tax=Cohnella silvisoli TaxID=2873699 RepID=A0ABV1KSM6_9BACL|nr:AraC family transcriptional regulator [Cohnella silvisoli]MCD9022488.1 AraC family transcriptional regulator [Cohnella silvisoli]